jgi:flagellin
MRINTNLTAMNTYGQYTANNNKIAGSVAKLSSGSAINSAADNAAGLAISEKMRAQIRGLQKSSTNAQDAISLVQTAEGSLEESTQILQRMRELAVQSASDTNENEIDRTALQDEFAQLQKELDDIAKNTTFNKKNLLDGSLAKTTSTMTNATLANSGMTIQLGKAATGTYNFSVTTKLESAAVAGKEPTSAELVKDGTGTYFTSTAVTAGNVAINDVTFGSNVKESDLLNGNYALKATYSDDSKTLTVTATGDNGQTFTATVNQTSLEALSGTATHGAVAMQFNAGADDAFQVNVNLANTIASNKTNFETLAENISKMTVSVAGGVTAKEAQYGVYANLTGAESVKLESGMSSVSFSNGVKVNFDTLTASAVDTANKATLEAGAPLAGAGVAGAVNTGIVDISYTNFKATDDSSIVDGANFQITANASDELVATITDGAGGVHTYQSASITTELATLRLGATEGSTTKSVKNIVFKDADGNAAFTLDLNADLTAGAINNTTAIADNASLDTDADNVIDNSGHNYTKIFGAGTTGNLNVSTDSSFSVEASKNDGLTFQVGANQGDDMVINIDKMDANYLGVASSSVATRTVASSAIKAVDQAINQVSAQRAYLGAVQNRLDHKIANLNTSAENLTSAESQIRDVDMAKEMTNFTNANILNQAATAMLAQANSLPQSVLSLIGG